MEQFYMYMVFFSLFLLSHVQTINSISPSSKLCHNHEMVALLEFKQEFSFEPSANPKFASWDGLECCLWDGVECKKETGHVVGLDLEGSSLYGSINSSSTLFKLVHLRKLNLADNHFNYSQIPSAISRLSNLSFLNLSNSFFSGQIPPELLGLSKLAVLDLAENVDNHFPFQGLLKLKTPNLRTLVQKLVSLEEIQLSTVHINSTVPEILANRPSLRALVLQKCGMHGEFPQSIFHLPNLEILMLWFNEKLTGYLPEFRHGRRLKVLKVSDTSFSGRIPDSIGELDSLVRLNLGACNFVGSVPASICNLTQLTFLALFENNFNAWKLPPCLGKLTGLTYLVLHETNLYGEFPSPQANLTRLTHLELSFNQLTGQIPSWIMNLTQLTFFDLSHNQLQGLIPSSFSQLTNLELIDLSSNQLSGRVESKTFFNLPKLAQLILARNNLSLLTPATTNTTSIQKFIYLALGSCNLQEFPSFLMFQDKLEVLLLEKNMLHGEIPHSICHVSSLVLLDLSNNGLSGRIPSCLGNFSSYLSILNLRGNNFQGTIPQIYSKESSLRMIDLSQNRLEGRIPRSLRNCRKLQALNLGENQMKDTFPFWLGGLSDLQVLILRSNKLHGSIVGEKQSHSINSEEFPKLRIIDLSDNGFTGNLPRNYFQKWTMMKIANVNWTTYLQVIMFYPVVGGLIRIGRYEYTMNMTYKGVETEYEKISSIFTAVDLSSNKFQGDIPESIGRLKGLQLLNLSKNHLSGFIPPTLGSLAQLESLDLSQNGLSGGIPNDLSQLTFLAFLNVSNNHLIGAIPKGKQFDTFENTSYINNSALCGYPLSRQCVNPPLLRPTTNDEGGDDDDYQFPGGKVGWMVILIGLGSGLIVGLIFGHHLGTRNHEWFVDKFGARQATRRSKIGRRRN